MEEGNGWHIHPFPTSSSKEQTDNFKKRRWAKEYALLEVETTRVRYLNEGS